ncbi:MULTISPECIES: sialidase family protein [unclassified Proteiniphilum]|jgi:sialidase-1|uniref:sialidase family protein n=1 Tax=unclassified Proteiniphilum TaxID=2622718 RepID=UPI00257AE28B|nr:MULTISPECIES: sialidase family protein [unclassified Proteiniphilum]MDD2247629.1 sialidase family protein [Proteiniphilum sp.]
MRRNLLIIASILLVLSFLSLDKKKEKNHQYVLWEQGTGEYNNYRIPALVVTNEGTLLAFCEGREAGDTGDINLLLKRSEDNGTTWSNEQVAWDDADNTCGNPCPVVDERTGRIWLFTSWNNGKDKESDIISKTSISPRLPYVCYSDDDGKTWSEPESLEITCRNPSWGWYATGPGIGIQIKNGRYKGRLVIPANHSYDDPKGNLAGGPYGYGAHVIYSDDHGKSWQISESIKPGCNESQVTELSDGTLLMNMRSYNNKQARAISYSTDGGQNWSEIEHDFQLVEPLCQAAVLNFGEVGGQQVHLFLNPAVPHGRDHLMLKVSLDDCRSWSNGKLVYEGPAAYSCITRLADGRVGLFFEAGEKSPYEKMIFISFDWNEIFLPGTVLQGL